MRWPRRTLADGGGGDPVAGPAQLALDPDRAPPGVLPGQAHDQRGELAGTGGPAAWAAATWAPHGADASAAACQESRSARHAAVFGVILVSAARTARPVQDMRGLGLVRRSTATSWRSVRISSPWTRRTGPAARASTAPSPAAGRPARRTPMPVMPTPEPQVKPGSRVFDHYRQVRRSRTLAALPEPERSQIAVRTPDLQVITMITVSVAKRGAHEGHCESSIFAD
jgi:hypothetical protein